MSPVLNVLLVEDEFLNRSLVRAILSRSQDHRLRTAAMVEASTLLAARQALAESAPDVILLDVRLPDGSGLDLAREWVAGDSGSHGSRAGDSRADIPPAGDARGGGLGGRARRRPLIVALTAGALPEQRAAAVDAGCDAVILKPYTADEFESVLVTLLDHRVPLTD
jgi:two-component system KDP operon response regulator KdpE